MPGGRSAVPSTHTEGACQHSLLPQRPERPAKSRHAEWVPSQAASLTGPLPVVARAPAVHGWAGGVRAGTECDAAQQWPLGRPAAHPAPDQPDPGLPGPLCQCEALHVYSRCMSCHRASKIWTHIQCMLPPRLFEQAGGPPGLDSVGAPPGAPDAHGVRATCALRALWLPRQAALLM